MPLPDTFPEGTLFFDCAEGTPVSMIPDGVGAFDTFAWDAGIKRPFRYTTVMSDGAPIEEAEFRELVKRSFPS